MEYLWLLFGFVFLIKGADILVDGASNIAKKYGVSPLIIGVIIVGFGTSAPELTTSLIAAVNQDAGLVFGNIIGSNIANVALVLGTSALIAPLTLKSVTVRREIPFTIVGTIIFFLLGADALFTEGSRNFFTRADAIILLMLFGIFLYYTIFSLIKEHEDKKALGAEMKEVLKKNIVHKINMNKAVGFVVIGIAGVVGGGSFVVNSASTIAAKFGLSQDLIGLTIVALGTSLPELVTSVVAAYKKQADIGVGNIVGSNIFNLLLIGGVASGVQPMPIEGGQLFNAILMGILLTIFFIFSLTSKTITRREGVVFVLFYFSFIGFSIYNNFAQIQFF